MRNKKWVRLLAYVTGTVNQELLLQNEYLAAENRILRAKLPVGTGQHIHTVVVLRKPSDTARRINSWIESSNRATASA